MKAGRTLEGNRNQEENDAAQEYLNGVESEGRNTIFFSGDENIADGRGDTTQNEEEHSDKLFESVGMPWFSTQANDNDTENTDSNAYRFGHCHFIIGHKKVSRNGRKKRGGTNNDGTKGPGDQGYSRVKESIEQDRLKEADAGDRFKMCRDCFEKG